MINLRGGGGGGGGWAVKIVKDDFVSRGRIEHAARQRGVIC